MKLQTLTKTLTIALIGGAAIDAKNDPFPDETLQQCLASDSVLLACIGGYKVRLSVCVCLCKLQISMAARYMCS